jgi:hypothetical protein
MTVSWGRRERWGVESGRVADFVGLLESAELDASGGYCGWNTTTPPGSVVHAPPSRPHPRSRIPAQRPTPIARNRERCRSCTQRSSLNTASNSKRKPHTADDTSHHTRSTMVGSAARSAHSSLISQHATSDRTDGTTDWLQAQIGRRSRTRTRGSARTLSTLPVPTPLACEVVP